MFRLASVWPLSTSGWWLYWWSVFLSIVLLFPKVLITKKPGSQRYISFSQPFLKTLFNKCLWSLPSCFYYSNHLGIIQICSYKLRLIRHHGSESPYQYLVLLQLQETKFQWHYEPVKKKDEGLCSVHREETQETCNRRPTKCLVLDMARLF